MLTFLKEYTTEILCLSVFIAIIQMILPDGKIKKDVIFTMLMVITILLVEPVISFLNKDIDIQEIFENHQEELEIMVAKKQFEQHYDEMLQNTFEDNLKGDIISRLKNVGYKVNSVECEIDKETYEPKAFKLEIETEDGFVQPVRIQVINQSHSQEKISEMDKAKIERILTENYGVTKDNIEINGR